MFRAEDERQEGAAQAAGGPENGADKSACRQSHWRSCLEAFKDPSGEESDSQGIHYHAPEAEGESAPVVQKQEVQASGPEAKEDPGDQKGPDAFPGEQKEPERNTQEVYLPHKEICCKGVSCEVSIRDKIKIF